MDDSESLSQKIARIREQIEQDISKQSKQAKQTDAADDKKPRKAPKQSKKQDDDGFDKLLSLMQVCKKKKSLKDKISEALSMMLCGGLVVAVLVAVVFLLIALGNWVFSM